MGKKMLVAGKVGTLLGKKGSTQPGGKTSNLQKLDQTRLASANSASSYLSKKHFK